MRPKLLTVVVMLAFVLIAFAPPADAGKGGGKGGGGKPQAACNDGADNDGDGYTDYPNDPGCSSATDDDEYNDPAPSEPPAGSNFCNFDTDICILHCAPGDSTCSQLVALTYWLCWTNGVTTTCFYEKS